MSDRASLVARLEEIAEWVSSGLTKSEVEMGATIREAIATLAAPPVPEGDTLGRLAREAVNSWACYARRAAEYDAIARLHGEIDTALRRAAPAVGEATTYDKFKAAHPELLAAAEAEAEADDARCRAVDLDALARETLAKVKASMAKQEQAGPSHRYGPAVAREDQLTIIRVALDRVREGR